MRRSRSSTFGAAALISRWLSGSLLEILPPRAPPRIPPPAATSPILLTNTVSSVLGNTVTVIATT
ncbi:hypothetical protein, partial [Rathayibacter sp. AY1C2]|uniref:hypothetical protein n=1 Tax=Rathayibacter sp. AY1C2 TaxID=2080535 RepID=UPI002157CB8E